MNKQTIVGSPLGHPRNNQTERSEIMQQKARAQIALLLSVLLTLGLTGIATLVGCGSSTAKSQSAAVAATVNGTEVLESDVSDYITTLRSSYGYESDEDWANFLASAGYSAETLREDIIKNYYAQMIVVRQAAEEAGITVDSTAVDNEIASIRSAYGYESDEDWASILESSGYTEEQYRSDIELSLLADNLMGIAVSVADPTQEELQTYADANVATYYSGKKSSQILFKSDDTETAQTVLAELQQSSDLSKDFSAAATVHSIDAISSGDGGNRGWDCLNTFSTDYSDALGALEVGQMSGLIESDDGYRIILCTDAYAPAAAESIDLTAIPAEIYAQLLIDVTSEVTSTAQNVYMQSLLSAADIVINPMPDGLHYDVDLSATADSESAQ